MTSQLWKQTIAIHILPNISRSKENQIMKFGQLTEYNMINIFLEKSFTKYGGTIPRPFPKKSKLNISLVQQSKVLYNLNFIVCHVEGYRNILKLICRPLASTSNKAFLRNKKMSGTSSLSHFLHRCKRKIYLLLYSLNWPNLIVCLCLLWIYWGVCVLCVLYLLISPIVAS